MYFEVVLCFSRGVIILIANPQIHSKDIVICSNTTHDKILSVCKQIKGTHGSPMDVSSKRYTLGFPTLKSTWPPPTLLAVHIIISLINPDDITLEIFEF